MKKFLVAVLVVAMVGMMGLVAFAAYPQTTEDWNVQAKVQEDGSVLITYAAPGNVNNVEMAIYAEKPDFTGKDMTDAGATYTDKIDNGGANHPTERLLTVGTGANAYPFEEGKTYYITLCSLTDGANWTWNVTPVAFTYSTKGEPVATADVSTIAFAVASVLGCGALAVRKKR
ncbi:MAG: hypothetical protein KH354_02680 [Clostridiales bacterium]|nr:hypothetical protein [Clostridiales bacterium]